MMEIKHAGHRGTSSDPVEDALTILSQVIGGKTPEAPLIPVGFWSQLRGLGFYFMHAGPDGRLQRVDEANAQALEWGTYFAKLMLDYSISRGVAAGDAKAGKYWAKA
jgi:hypothetical protein